MNIEKKILLFLLFNVYLCKSQSKNYCGFVEYSIVKNIAYYYVEDHKLIFNDSVSYSQEINIDKSKSKLLKENNDGMLTNKIINGRKNETSAFYYTSKDDFYFSEIWDNDVLIVKEDPFDWKWKLHSETKKIGSYNCQKATIEFRGRNYTAWFTNQIPVRYGPWKFQGLSGFILEVYDDDDFIHITTRKIIINDNSNCLIPFDNNQLKNSITIKDYLKKRIDLTKDKFARISSKLPKGSKPLVLDENCEGCNSGKIEIFNEQK